jgi:hypothetical protein
VRLDGCQLVNDSGEVICAAEVWQTDTSLEGAQLTADEGPAPIWPNANLRFRPEVAGVVHYAVRCGPSPAGASIDDLPQYQYVVQEHEIGAPVTILRRCAP